MANKDQGLVTFYNDDEGWNFTAPIEPLLTNAVIRVMLTGEFKEAATKRIQVPDFSRSVVERFIQDLAKGAGHYYNIQTAAEYAEHVQLARLAHRFDAEQLVTAYLQRLLNFSTNGRSDNDTPLNYESCKVVFELSAKNLYLQAIRQIQWQPDLIFENDDDILLKSLCDENVKTENANNYQGVRANETLDLKNWISRITRHKAHRCLKVLLDYAAFNTSELSLCATDLTLPEDLISKLLEKDPNLSDYFIQYQNTTGVGVVLRQRTNDHNTWSKAFKQGFMEIIKFAPKAMLLLNDGGEHVFGETAIHHGWINCVEYLLEQGWKPTANALTMAMSDYQNSALVKLLLKHVKPDSRTINAISIRNNYKVHDPERWACIDLVEKAALENALESDLYKIYSKSP